MGSFFYIFKYKFEQNFEKYHKMSIFSLKIVLKVVCVIFRAAKAD